ncbi:MAG: P27 family phage terminase small subunit [Lachnospiraceae bacterium]|nr:P27 family phage terminase small subunit [Lachnospiraceae bacterium]RHE67889.1 RNA polymerase subunit sigma-70 [Mediterraneibacter gnavus]
MRVEIKEDLLDQLVRNGTTGKYYIDLVDKYMDFWDLENELIADIKKRGAIVEYNNGGGQKGQKKNDSIDQRIKVNAQMLKILDSLGIKPVGDDSGDDEDEL